MKLLLINLKNLIPYLFLVAVYFFFVNLEARKEQYNINNKPLIKDDKTVNNDTNLRFSIPVIPYNNKN